MHFEFAAVQLFTRLRHNSSVSRLRHGYNSLKYILIIPIGVPDDFRLHVLPSPCSLDQLCAEYASISRPEEPVNVPSCLSDAHLEPSGTSGSWEHVHSGACAAYGNIATGKVGCKGLPDSQLSPRSIRRESVSSCFSDSPTSSPLTSYGFELAAAPCLEDGQQPTEPPLPPAAASFTTINRHHSAPVSDQTLTAKQIIDGCRTGKFVVTPACLVGLAAHASVFLTGLKMAGKLHGGISVETVTFTHRPDGTVGVSVKGNDDAGIHGGGGGNVRADIAAMACVLREIMVAARCGGVGGTESGAEASSHDTEAWHALFAALTKSSVHERKTALSCLRWSPLFVGSQYASALALADISPAAAQLQLAKLALPDASLLFTRGA